MRLCGFGRTQCRFSCQQTAGAGCDAGWLPCQVGLKSRACALVPCHVKHMPFSEMPVAMSNVQVNLAMLAKCKWIGGIQPHIRSIAKTKRLVPERQKNLYPRLLLCDGQRLLVTEPGVAWTCPAAELLPSSLQPPHEGSGWPGEVFVGQHCA